MFNSAVLHGPALSWITLLSPSARRTLRRRLRRLRQRLRAADDSEILADHTLHLEEDPYLYLRGHTNLLVLQQRIICLQRRILKLVGRLLIP